MAEKVAQKLNINEKTIVKCNDLELIEGNLENPLWIMETNNKLKVVLDPDEYMNIMENMKNIMKENLELKLEKAILSELPIDYDDVKAVVLEEMKHNKDKSITEILNKIKLEHPNLFMSIDFDKLF